MTTQPSSDGRPNPAAPLALLGGTFDPPHIGHLFLAECARIQFNAQTVLFLPAGDPYKKTRTEGAGLRTQEAPQSTKHQALDTTHSPEVPPQHSATLSPQPSVLSPSPAAHRAEMTRLAAAGNPHFAVDDREVRRAGPSYTVDTLEELRAEGHTNLILILGADALADLPTWKQPERIFQLATVAVAPKPWQSSEAQLPSPDSAGAGLGVRAARHELINMPPLAISSTLIRARVANGQPIRYLVPDAVERYIAEHGLYAK